MKQVGIILALLAGLAATRVALAFPDFAFHAGRDVGYKALSIESDVTNNRVRTDTCRIDNAGDAVLNWTMRIIAEDESWLESNDYEGQVNPGQANWFVLRTDPRNLDNGSYLAILRIRTNDPTKDSLDVPVMIHKEAFPLLDATWPIPQQGEWWGIDMDRINDSMYWGGSYSFNLNVRNRGTAQMDCDTIICSNAYFTISPGRFSLAAGAARQVQVNLLANEVGNNTGTITSISNAWDPREINFRITATVLPSFRRGGSVPDQIIAEDSQEFLVADLDTIFIASDAGTEITVAPGIGLLTRLARNKELFIRGRANWNGESSVVLTATLDDSTLADTFAVTVTPVADAPEPFDLYYPNDGDTLYFDGGDSLLVWQSCLDPDMDTVSYSVSLYDDASGAPLISREGLSDTTLSIRGLYYNPEVSGLMRWTVVAVGGGEERNAWSEFRFYLAPGRQDVSTEIEVPIEHQLISLFPNPFNSSAIVALRPTRAGNCKVELYTSDGRSAGVIVDQNLAAGSYQYRIELPANASGAYLMVALVDGKKIVRQLNYQR